MSAVDRAFDLDEQARAAIAGDARRGARTGTPIESRAPGEADGVPRQADGAGLGRRRESGGPRDEPERPTTERSGVPEVSFEDAGRYIERYRDERPWLQMLDGASPQARRIIVAADMAGGHGHIRHEGWVTDDDCKNRAAYLEDPAQLDPDKRQRGIDGLRADEKPHRCNELATRITSPDAYAVAFALGTRDPGVQEALRTAYDRRSRPSPVEIPIAELLGGDGHRFCAGWMLKLLEEGGSTDGARRNRKEWRDAKAEGRTPDIPEPAVDRVPTFEGGTMIFVIGPNKAGDGYEITSMYPQPRDDMLPPQRPQERTRETQ